MKRATAVRQPDSYEASKSPHLRSPPLDEQGPEKFRRQSSTPAKSRPSRSWRASETGESRLDERKDVQKKPQPSLDGSYRPLDLDVSADTTTASDVGAYGAVGGAQGRSQPTNLSGASGGEDTGSDASAKLRDSQFND